MGKIEREVQKRARKQNIQHAVLSVIGVAGILAVMMVAPNTLQLLKYTPLGRRKAAYRVNDSLDRLIRGGYVTFETRNGKKFLRLTPKGETKLAHATAGDMRMVPPRRWDKRWRIVIFDIPESRRKARDLLRDRLIAIGFVRLQASVWVYPHDCEDVIILIKTSFVIGREVLYIVADHVERDFELRSRFGLRV